jgi:hypothetical protein
MSRKDLPNKVVRIPVHIKVLIDQHETAVTDAVRCPPEDTAKRFEMSRDTRHRLESAIKDYISKHAATKERAG